MRKHTNRSGFTLIELMIVVAIIAIVAAIAIPKLMSARISANENAAIATLRSIAAAQHQIESSVAIDTDGDGGGEFGYFGELAGIVPLRVFLPGTGPAAGVDPDDILNPPILPTAFGDVIPDALGDGIVERQGYYFKMWLPDATVGGLTPGLPEDGGGGAVTGAFPSPDDSEILWACYAWPVTREKTGNRAFFINQEGDVIAYNNRNPLVQYDALNGPAFDAAYSDETGGGDMGAALGLTAMGFTANDQNIWTTVGN